jgi:hypothetical protein
VHQQSFSIEAMLAASGAISETLSGLSNCAGDVHTRFSPS